MGRGGGSGGVPGAIQTLQETSKLLWLNIYKNVSRQAHRSITHTACDSALLCFHTRDLSGEFMQAKLASLLKTVLTCTHGTASGHGALLGLLCNTERGMHSNS